MSMLESCKLNISFRNQREVNTNFIIICRHTRISVLDSRFIKEVRLLDNKMEINKNKVNLVSRDKIIERYEYKNMNKITDNNKETYEGIGNKNAT